MQDFRELKVWQKAHQLSLLMYPATSSFPREEVYGLTAQLRRSTTSIEFNIAEGRAMESDRAFGRFLRIALGSAFEVECEVLLAKDLGYLNPDSHSDFEAKIQEIKRMLTALLKSISDATQH